MKVSLYVFFLFIGIVLHCSLVVASKPELLEAPIREFSIIASDESYYPSKIIVYRGEQLHLFLTSTAKSSNSQSCFFLDKTNIHVSLNKGEIQELNLKFEEAGVYPFFCPTQKIKGEIIVLKRQDEILKEQKTVKSSKGGSKWLPQDDVERVISSEDN